MNGALDNQDLDLDSQDEPITEFQCKGPMDALEALQARAEKEGGKFEEEGKELAESDDFSLKFEVEWETVDVRFHVPKVTMSKREWRFHLPQTRTKRVDISFDVPEIRMENKVIGSYIKCNKLKCRKADIVTKVPVFSKGRKVIKFDVPEITWDDTTIDVYYPEFSRSEVIWKFDVPRFKLKEVHVGGAPVYDEERKEKSAALEKKAKEFAEKLQADLSEATLKLNECFVGQLLIERATVDKEFTSAIAFLEASITAIKQQGAEAPKFEDGAGQPVDMEAQLNQLRTERVAALAAIDEQIAELTAKSSDGANSYAAMAFNLA